MGPGTHIVGRYAISVPILSIMHYIISHHLPVFYRFDDIQRLQYSGRSSDGHAAVNAASFQIR